MMNFILDRASAWKARFDSARLERRWEKLRAMGMHLGQGVNLPASTWVDTSTCFLISIGDWCGFGEQCLILSHDAQMDEFLDAGLIGRVTIRESCHFGARSVILPGVEIGPRTIVGANSVVSKSLPPDTVCAGVPARPICSLDEYIARHRNGMAKGSLFSWNDYNQSALTPARLKELKGAVEKGAVYITGGFSEELKGGGGTKRTPYNETAKPNGVEYLKMRDRTG